MKITSQRRERGIAIIIVMISIFVLAMLAGALAYSTKVETKLASNANNETQLQWAGRSGIDYARWCLAEEALLPGPGQRYDSLDQAWAGGTSETNEVLAAIQHENIELGPGVTIRKWTMIDAERKFNVNAALGSQPVLQKLLGQIGAEPSDIPTIISSIQDWIDPDDDQRKDGAESEYYQTLDPPYYAKNGPIDELSELLFIKGVTPELYWGQAEAPKHPPTIFQKHIVTRSGLQAVDTSGATSLREVLTPVSNGTLNILTASAAQLQILPEVDDAIAAEIIQLRQERDAGSFLPYGSPSDLLVNTRLGREVTPLVANYCNFRSSVFEVTVVVQVGMSTRTYVALVKRNNPKDMPILSMKWEDGDHSPATTAPEQE